MSAILQLNLPSFNVKTRKVPSGLQIYDSFRKKYVALTPEEWVRQHFAHFLTAEKNVPESHIWIEHEIKYGQVKKRPDLTIVDRDMKPWCIVECKAPHIQITEDVFLQWSSYQSVLRAPFGVMTNGVSHYYAEYQPKSQNFVYLKDLPNYA